MSIINDLATLANSGWTASDLIAVIKADKEKSVTVPTESKPVPDAPAPAAPAASATPDEPDEPDYKALYEQAKKDLDEIQNKNTRKTVEVDEPDINEIIKNIKAEIC